MQKWIPLHEVREPEKVERLKERMLAHGWQGVPLVAWHKHDSPLMGSQLLTGTHRLAAAHAIGIADEVIPVIDLPELFAKAGLDYDARADAPETLVDWRNPYSVREWAREELGILAETYGIEKMYLGF
jgi:hypothetical protein